MIRPVVEEISKLFHLLDVPHKLFLIRKRVHPPTDWSLLSDPNDSTFLGTTLLGASS